MELGPFVLEAPFARGAMGEVWGARHPADGRRVAVKVLTDELAREPKFQAAFVREVRAVARLHHPGVVTVYDHGFAPAGGALPAGSPWLVMERAPGGSLDQAPPPPGWPALERLVRELLAALAHAHAHGVVHRDLKPGNVLLGGAGQALLSDFGLAFAGEDEAAALPRAGTPRYMAPEQIVGRWREHGPWTDLYALGCLAWELAAGRPVFPPGPGFSGLVLEREPGPLPRRIALPEGFEAWLRRLLQKEPGQRFRRAADAVAALDRLAGAPLLPPDVLDTPAPAAAPVDLAAETWTRPSPTLSDPPPAPAPAAPAVARSLPPAPAPCPIPVPGFPPDWRTGAPPSPPATLPGAGLGLYRLRARDPVAREGERDQLWGALGEALRTRRAGSVLLRGAAGTGKSTLARWLGARAAELGVATPLFARHGPAGGAEDGLGPALERALGTRGLPSEELLQRLNRLDLGEPAGARQLAAWLRPGGAKDERVTSVADRDRLLARLLAALAEDRGLVFVLDDVQWGPTALRLVQALREQPLPLLFVLTAQAEALGEAPEARALLGRLAPVEIPVDPLGPDATVRLIQDTLPVEAGLARALAARTAGNPLFTTQLLADWIDRELLVDAGAGFTLRPGAAAELPDGLHTLWGTRLARRLAGDEAQVAARQLELAAVLGNTVSWLEWRAGCAALGLPDPEGAAERLLAHGLFLPGEAGPAFVHGMLRESLLRRAREEGHLAQLHGVAADGLAGAAGPEALGRRAAHELAAGREDAAAASLLAAARQAFKVDDHALAEALNRRRDEVLARLGVGPEDPRALDGLIVEGRVRRRAGDEEGAMARFDRVLDVARARGHRALAATAAMRRGEALYLSSRLPEALDALGEARAWTDPVEPGPFTDPGSGPARWLRAAVLRLQGHVALEMGALDAAEEGLDAAWALLEGSGDLHTISLACHSLGKLALLRGQPAAARAWFERAAQAGAEVGGPNAAASAWQGIGETWRAEGDLDRAAQAYRRALVEAGPVGGARLASEVNLALVEVAAGRLPEAALIAAALLDRVAAGRRHAIQLLCHAILLREAAERSAGDEVDRRLAAVEDHFGRSHYVDPDLLALLDAAGAALSPSDPARSRAVATLRAALGWT